MARSKRSTAEPVPKSTADAGEYPDALHGVEHGGPGDEHRVDVTVEIGGPVCNEVGTVLRHSLTLMRSSGQMRRAGRTVVARSRRS